MPAALEHAVEDGFREIRIVEHSTPRGQRLVGREDHWALVHLYEERIEIVTKTGAVVPHPRCARGVSILPEHRAALLDRVHGARGHLYFQRQSLWELGPHAEAWLKSDPVCLDTVWTRITAAKEAGHDRQGAKANHDAWQ